MIGVDSAVPLTGSFHISQGEFAVGRDQSSISTILGSCVATCLHDPVARVGGMNHFLLPEGTGSGVAAASFGANAMELLINALIKAGAQRGRMQAKVFGGARMVAGLSDIGAKNARFVIEFLEKEGMQCVGRSLGGDEARRVQFWPGDGRARQKLVGRTDLQEKPILKPVPVNDIELF